VTGPEGGHGADLRRQGQDASAYIPCRPMYLTGKMRVAHPGVRSPACRRLRDVDSPQPIAGRTSSMLLEAAHANTNHSGRRTRLAVGAQLGRLAASGRPATAAAQNPAAGGTLALTGLRSHSSRLDRALNAYGSFASNDPSVIDRYAFNGPRRPPRA
jgi:hypothetical protein